MYSVVLEYQLGFYFIFNFEKVGLGSWARAVFQGLLIRQKLQVAVVAVTSDTKPFLSTIITGKMIGKYVA